MALDPGCDVALVDWWRCTVDLGGGVAHAGAVDPGGGMALVH